jgi:hypothetical protein
MENKIFSCVNIIKYDTVIMVIDVEEPAMEKKRNWLALWESLWQQIVFSILLSTSAPFWCHSFISQPPQTIKRIILLPIS